MLVTRNLARTMVFSSTNAHVRVTERAILGGRKVSVWNHGDRHGELGLQVGNLPLKLGHPRRPSLPLALPHQTLSGNSVAGGTVSPPPGAARARSAPPWTCSPGGT